PAAGCPPAARAAPPGMPSPVLHARFLGPPHAARATPAGGELLLADRTQDLIGLGLGQATTTAALLPFPGGPSPTSCLDFARRCPTTAAARRRRIPARPAPTTTSPRSQARSAAVRGRRASCAGAASGTPTNRASPMSDAVRRFMACPNSSATPRTSGIQERGRPRCVCVSLARARL